MIEGGKDGIETEKHGNIIIIKVSGISKHTAFPEGGVNAIYELTKALVDGDLIASDDRQKFEFLNTVNQDFEGTGLMR